MAGMKRLVSNIVHRSVQGLGYRLTRIPEPQALPSGALLVQGVDNYGTHFIPLAAAVARTTGPVLELGMGDHSTPLLHLMCHDRLLVSADSNPRWMSRYEAFRSPTHHLHAVGDWREWRVPEQHDWAVCFIDCAPTEQRHELITRLQDRARFIVVHDTETDVESANVLGFEESLARFKHRSDYRVFRPFTTVVSDVEPFVLTEAEDIRLA